MLYSIHWGFLLSNLWRWSSHIRTGSFKTKRRLFLKIHCIYFIGSSRSILNTLSGALNCPLSQPLLFIMEHHLIPITSIAPITHPWLPSLVWASQWRFMVSFLAPCTNKPVPSICPCRAGTDTHTHTVTWIPGLCTHISQVISTLLVFDHYLL